MMEDSKTLFVVRQISLIIIGVVIGGFIASYTGFTFPGAEAQTIEYLYSYSTQDVDLVGAEWKIVFCVRNTGRSPLTLTNVYVDGEDAQSYGLIHGESLDSGVNMGTSLPSYGYQLEKGEGFEVYVWIREGFYESGEKVLVSLNRIGFLGRNITVTLSSNEAVTHDENFTL